MVSLAEWPNQLCHCPHIHKRRADASPVCQTSKEKRAWGRATGSGWFQGTHSSSAAGSAQCLAVSTQGAGTNMLFHFCSVQGDFPLLWDSRSVQPASGCHPDLCPQPCLVSPSPGLTCYGHGAWPFHSNFCRWGPALLPWEHLVLPALLRQLQQTSEKHILYHGRVEKEFCHNAVISTRNKAGACWYSIQSCPVQPTPLLSPFFGTEEKLEESVNWWNADILPPETIKPYHTHKEDDTWVCWLLWVCVFFVAVGFVWLL